MRYKSSDRLFVCGMTGWGKSFFVKNAIYPQLTRVVFHDPKRQHNELHDVFVHNPTQLQLAWDRNITRIIYQPETIHIEDFNTVCHMIYSQGNTVLIVDESSFYTGPNTIPYWYEMLIKMGRSRNCGVVSLSQQPTFIKGVIISESDYLVAFRLEYEADRRKLAGKVGNAAFKTGNLPKYHYLLYQAGIGCSFHRPI